MSSEWERGDATGLRVREVNLPSKEASETSWRMVLGDLKRGLEEEPAET